MEIHEDRVLIRGDVWKIYGRLRNADGTPMDVAAAIAGDDLAWSLVLNGTTLILNTDDASFEVIDNDEGFFVMTILPDATSTVAAGRYTDFLQHITPEGPITKWTGEYHVKLGPPTS